MRIPDLIAHNPVFLVAEDANAVQRMVGSAFIVNVRSTTFNRNYGYLVTARHCVLQGQQLGPLGVRVNKRRSPGPVSTDHTLWEVQGSETFGPLDNWLFHEDPVHDVAVHRFMPSAHDHMVVVVEDESCATDRVIENEHIGIGDELAVVGLFASHVGREVNRPIVRGGIISAMPDEPLRDELTGLSYHAYLAEVRSIGGLSGSPVWIVITPGRIMPGSTAPERRLHFYLLGLIRGHWSKGREWLSDHVDNELDILNTGIAIVTPIQRALDIIHSASEIELRRRADELEELPSDFREVAPG